MITKTLINTWPLFLGMALLMLGNGLLGTLVSWRATYEGFAPSTTGWVMMGYYLGFIVGSMLTQKLVQGVGYIRVFAALASLASTAALLQVLYIDPIAWFILRVLAGFCFAGIYVIAESWLNACSTNETRGQTLSLYMLVSFAGLAGGQWLMNLSPPSGSSLFILISILLSLALVPILIKRTETPEVEVEQRLSIRELIRLSPAGVFGVFISAIAHGALFAMGAVFAVTLGMSVSDTVLFMSSFILFGALGQWPIGWLSDKFDRRLVMLFSSLFATLTCILLLFLSPQEILFFIAFAGLGATSLPLYSISIAHTNDRLNPDQMTSASSTIVLVLGVGSVIGPLLAGYLLDTIGPNGYLFHLGATHILIALCMTYFVLQRDAVSPDDMTHYQAIPLRPSAVTLEAFAQETEETQGPEAMP